MPDEVSLLVGQTPLIKLEALSQEIGAEVYLKYETKNPGASIKDRAVLSMIDHAEQAGEIAPGKTVLIEPTSGNTGVAIAMLGAARGYEVIIAMPASMSLERRALIAAFGAKLELTEAAAGMAGAVKRAEELAKQVPSGWIVGQFTNKNNPLAHQEHTGPEIVQQLGAFPDHVVAGVGTGGTISGVGHYLKAQKAPTRLFAVEPAESPLITQTLAGEKPAPASHGIQGIGANFIPATLDLAVLSAALTVTTDEALQTARSLAQSEGLLVGISSGANVAAIKKLVAKHPAARGKTIVSFAVDTGERYLSTPLFANQA